MDYVVRYLYQRDRTEGQPWTIYLGAEKAGVSEHLAHGSASEKFRSWRPGGYASQTPVSQVRRDIEDQDRPPC